MKIVIVSTFLNHYHAPLADELYRLTGGDFRFVETKELPESFKKGGFPEYEKPYLIRAWRSPEEERLAKKWAVEADVMEVGGGKFVVEYEKIRLKYGKLSFESAERILKKGWINAISPTNLSTQFHYHLSSFKKPLYKLCIGGFVARDMYVQHAYKGKCYKFAYFPAIPSHDPERIFEKKGPSTHLKIIWCARFIRWKHPELAVLLAERLKKEHYDFEINMIGSGVLFEEMTRMIQEKNLTGYVNLLGNMPNSKVSEMMAEHHVFLFTSDRNEGWGVVLNEAMGQVCCPVASHMIGAVPFLLKHKQDGMVFRSKSLDSLTESMKYLLDNPDEIKRMAVSAYKEVKNNWTPELGAERMIRFFDAFLQGDYSFSYPDGPFSIAEPLSEKYPY